MGVNKNLQVLQLLPKLSQQVAILDAEYLNESNLPITVMQKWYFQHVLLYALRRFSDDEVVTLPKHLFAFCSITCFGSKSLPEYNVMIAMYRQLIMFADPDHDVLLPVLHDFIQALRTQNLAFRIVDPDQLATCSFELINDREA